MSDVSAVTKYFSTANEGFITTTSDPVSSGATSVPLSSMASLTDGSVYVGIIEPGTTNEQTFTGTVSQAATAIIDVVWTRGTNVAHVAGVSVVDYVTGTDWNMMVAGILKTLNQDGTLKASVLNAVWPVNSVYVETGGINPGTTLGFGTWVAFGQGRTLVGAGTSDQAFAAGATGGESTHLLTTPEMPAHAHGVNDPGHAHTYTAWRQGTYPGGGILGGGALYGNPPISAGATTGSGTGIWLSNTGGGDAHNNLQPYIVTYFWRRSA
jgi:microcystin-dependent protein